MREYSVPATVTVGAEENLLDAVYAHEVEHPGETLLKIQSSPGQWDPVTAAEFAARVTAVARGLIASGVGAGDRVALLSRTRFEWTLLDYAILAVGAVTVPIYETSSASQIAWILEDSGAVGIVVETAHHASLVKTDGFVKVIDEGAVDSLVEAGSAVAVEEVHARRAAVGADHLATLIYTSGTTGRPKGCELSHRNLLTEIAATREVLHQLLAADGSVLLFLPLAHVFGKVIQCGAIASRTVIGHTPDTRNLLADLGTFQPTFLLAAPRVFEKVYNGARQKAHDGGKGGIFDAAADVAIAWSRAQDTGGASFALKLKHAVFDKLVYGRLREATGGHVVAAVSGSAPLGERLGHFFRGVGIPILEGYGLTETTAGVTVNALGAQRVGSVGRPVPGHAVRIAEDGEILLSGGIVFRGYWNNPAATAEAIEDGWFHSGDIGALDDAGFLTITGRKKEILVTAGGKNVAPAVLEDRLRAHALVGQCMVVGDGQPFIAALITIDPEALPGWRERNGKAAGEDPSSAADLVDDPELRGEIAAAVEEANQAVSRAEQIRKFRILPVDFTEGGGELTPTLKIKRSVVADRYAKEIQALYSPATDKQPA
ncbi:long-chain fatty acid--CoA ligase [Pseudonocardia xishanensis]|uniref:Acyl-CoA synthetase n=1 Tax=Pseudonocardia xishanensis TaxID=630995 RepID=A0ABP8RRZ7_9PSEU